MRFKEFWNSTKKQDRSHVDAKDIVNGAQFILRKHGAHSVIIVISADDPAAVRWKSNNHGEERVTHVDELLAVLNTDSDKVTTKR